MCLEAIKKKLAIPLFLLAVALLLSACGRNVALSEPELAAASEFTPDTGTITSLTKEALTRQVAAENPSVTKVFLTAEGDYLFFCQPDGYNGPIYFMLVIDSETNQTTALRIISHEETEHYVRDMESPWFVDRFVNKNAHTYLERVKLDPQKPYEIVAITGSTVTTDAIILGVNEAFGVYNTLEKSGADSNQPGVVALTDSTGKSLGSISLEQLKNLETYRRKLVIHSSLGDTTHDFRGVRLSEAIKLVNPALLTNHKAVYAVGTDQYSAALTIAEVMQENNVFIMFEDSGKPIEDENGNPRGMRLVILKDDYGQRFTNYLYELRFE